MKQVIEALKAADNFRSLPHINILQRYIISENKQYLNLSSNDYLGLSDIDLQRRFFETIDLQHSFLMSNPSSRLMTGNSAHYDRLESLLAEIFDKEAALVLSSGFLVNSGVLPAVTLPGDLILADKAVHASIIDGLKLCACDWERYRHNDMAHLRSLLEKKRDSYNNIIVVTESVFSMDGDIAPLRELAALKEEFGFLLYLDEAHAFGVRGATGLGVAEELGVLKQADFIVATMGKAIASQGAFVVCSQFFKTVLINRMRPLIFSTALPPLSLLWSEFIIRQLPNFKERREKLTELSTQLSTLLERDVDNFYLNSHIIPYIIGNNAATLKVSEKLKQKGFWVTAIRHPTVPSGSARLRVSLNSGLSVSEINDFYQALRECL